MERLQSVQNVRPMGERGSRRGCLCGAQPGLRGRNGVPIMLIVLIVPNAIASRAADGIGLLKCLAHRACFLWYVVTTSFRVAAPSHHQRRRGLFHHRPRTQRQRPRRPRLRAFTHTQDQQAVFFGGIDTACWFDYAMCADV